MQISSLQVLKSKCRADFAAHKFAKPHAFVGSPPGGKPESGSLKSTGFQVGFRRGNIQHPAELGVLGRGERGSKRFHRHECQLRGKCAAPPQARHHRGACTNNIIAFNKPVGGRSCRTGASPPPELVDRLHRPDSQHSVGDLSEKTVPSSRLRE